MRYIPQTPEDIEQMLEAIGIDSVDDLFENVAGKYRLRRPLDIPAPSSCSKASAAHPVS